MCCFRLTISASYRKAVECHLKTAQHLGHLRQVQYLLAILAVRDGHSVAQIALVLRVHEKTVAAWGNACCGYGVQGAPRQKPTGRPPQLTPTQQEALATLLAAGPGKAGFSGACWRAPMLQPFMDDRFGGFYHVFSSAPWRKHLGCSYQKAALVSEQLDEAKRQGWRTTTWPQILRRAKARQALLRCGDAASFPQWGTLTSTWARRGQQPQVKTSGKRQGSKVFGLMDSLSGGFLYQGQEGRLNSAADLPLLRRVLAQTTQPILLLQEGAKYHTSAETTAFLAPQAARLQVVQLPTYAPDSNPREQRWKQIKQQATHLHDLPTFEALTEQVEQALVKFSNAPEEILALCSLPTELAQAA